MKYPSLLLILLFSAGLARGTQTNPTQSDQKTLKELERIVEKAIIEIKQSLNNQTYTNLKGAERYFMETIAKTIPWICAIVIVWSNQPIDDLWRFSLIFELGLILNWACNKWVSFLKRKV